jgi:hypothetical protein
VSFSHSGLLAAESFIATRHHGLSKKEFIPNLLHCKENKRLQVAMFQCLLILVPVAWLFFRRAVLVSWGCRTGAVGCSIRTRASAADVANPLEETTGAVDATALEGSVFLSVLSLPQCASKSPGSQRSSRSSLVEFQPGTLPADRQIGSTASFGLRRQIVSRHTGWLVDWPSPG